MVKDFIQPFVVIFYIHIEFLIRALAGWNTGIWTKYAVRFMFMNVVSSLLLTLYQWQDVYIDQRILLYELNKYVDIGLYKITS